ncbi:MAG: 6-bladed beta-propeller [Bacteroidales bacterium]|jgi:hypothetical protein
MKANQLISLICLLSVPSLFWGCDRPEKSLSTDLPYRINWPDFLGDPEELTKLGSIAESIDYITLKTPDSAKVGMMFEMRITDNNIFVLDQTFSLFVFDIEGNFRTKINHLGRGPGEYPGLNGSMINTDNNLIGLHYGSKVFFYDFSGNPIKVTDIKYGSYPVSANWLTDDKYVGLMNVSPLTGESPDDISTIIFDTEGNVLKKERYFVEEKRPESMTSWVERLGHLTRIKEGVLVKEPYNDTTFIIKDDLERIPFIINYLGRHRAPREFLETPMSYNLGENRAPSDVASYIMSYRSFIYPAYFFVTFKNNNRNYSGVWDYRNMKAFSVSDAVAGLTDDIDFGLPFVAPRDGFIANNPDEMVDLIEPIKLLSDPAINPREGSRLAEIMEDMSIDDNPVIRIIKTKAEISPLGE